MTSLLFSRYLSWFLFLRLFSKPGCGTLIKNVSIPAKIYKPVYAQTTPTISKKGNTKLAIAGAAKLLSPAEGYKLRPSTFMVWLTLGNTAVIGTNAATKIPNKMAGINAMANYDQKTGK